MALLVLYSLSLREVNGNRGYALLSDIKQTKEMSLLNYQRRSVVELMVSSPTVEYAYSLLVSTLFQSTLHFSLNSSSSNATAKRRSCFISGGKHKL